MMYTIIASKKYYLLLLFLFLFSFDLYAQIGYYYKEKKTPLTLNEYKVCISIPKESEKTCERIHAHANVLNKIHDDKIDIFIISRPDFEKLTSQESWEEDAKSVILTSCYFTEDNKEVYSTPYLNVKLKKEQDMELLASYANKYKLRIVGDGPFSPRLPLWYVLVLTPESNLNSLDCANRIYESGDFAESTPDFASINSLINTTVRNQTSETSEESSIYDMQGRKTQQELKKGIYIQNGRKYIVK